MNEVEILGSYHCMFLSFILHFHSFAILRWQRLGKPICAYWAFEQLTYTAVDYIAFELVS